MDLQIEPQVDTPPQHRSRFVVAIVVLLAVLGAGALSGWTAASQKTSVAAAGHGQDAHAGHDHAAAGASALSKRTLANLGVELGSAKLGDFVRTIEVPAEVEPLPLSERPIASPVAGVVRSITVAPGHVVAAGDPIAEVLRDPLPQPTLGLTEALLKPLSEDHHSTAMSVRTAALALKLASAERQRLGGAEGSQGVGRVIRDAEYAEERARLELANARHEASRHGFTPEQITALEAGDYSLRVPDTPDIRRVLERNRLWSPEADACFDCRPACRACPTRWRCLASWPRPGD